MSESQSRYSIVERLTKQKLDIMEAKTSLTDGIAKAKQSYETRNNDVEYDKKVIDQEAEKQKSELDKSLKDTEKMIKHLEDRKESKEKLYTEKIEAIDEALVQLKDISESAQSSS